MPCHSVPNWDFVYEDTLSCIMNVINGVKHDSVVIGGDFNLNFSSRSDIMKVVNDFNQELLLSFTDHLLPTGDTYIFRNLA